MKKMNWMAATLAMLMCLGLSMDAQADVPGTMTYNGTLSDGSGSPVDATVGATFRIYDAQSGGSEVWSEQFATIDVNSGSFSVQLGATEPLGEVFDGSPYWLEVSIDGETLSPRTAVESVPYALRANKANDADTVAGQTPSDLTASVPTTASELDYDNATSGLSATDVQAALDELAQLRARVDAIEAGMQDSSGNTVTIADLDTRISQNSSDLSTQGSDISTLQTDVATNTSDISTNSTAISTNTSDIATNSTAISTNTGDISTNSSTISSNSSAISSLQTDVVANTSAVSTNTTAITGAQSDIATNAADITANASAIATNQSDIADQAIDIAMIITQMDQNWTNIDTLQDLTQDMSRTTINSQPAVVFTGVNVHVRNGLGTTSGASSNTFPQVNGVGNLVVGYDEARSSGNDKSGSHNLVVGSHNNYTNFGGLIAGNHNTVSAPFASVTGGEYNTASGSFASVSGGSSNTASSRFASVSGGGSNEASGRNASVSGGSGNTASGSEASVSGGYVNEAAGLNSALGGGRYETLTDNYYWQAGDLIEVE